METTRRGFATLLASIGLSAREASADDGPYDVAVTSDVMVRVRDGVHLATDLHRPARDGRPVPGRFPVILERTPYGKTVPSRSEISVRDPVAKSRAEVARFFVSQGYVVVYQDCRGRYSSEGQFVKYLSDGLDGYDCCAWITAQPWCDGKIGTMGLSYAAHTQGALACTDPAGSGGHVPGQRGLRRRLPGRNPPGRRLRAEASHLGLFRGDGEPQRARRSGAAQGAEGHRHQGVVRPHALEAGPLAAQRRAGI